MYLGSFPRAHRLLTGSCGPHVTHLRCALLRCSLVAACQKMNELCINTGINATRAISEGLRNDWAKISKTRDDRSILLTMPRK